MISPVLGYNTMAHHHGKAQVGSPELPIVLDAPASVIGSELLQDPL